MKTRDLLGQSSVMSAKVGVARSPREGGRQTAHSMMPGKQAMGTVMDVDLSGIRP